LSALRDRPTGTVRITAGEHPAISILQPALKRLLPDHPDINVEIIVDYGLTDIVSEGYDAGVRMGEQVAKDMIAVHIGPEMRMAVVASPAYFERHSMPQTPQDLTSHKCINTRLPTYGGLFPWGLEKDGHEVKVRSEGQLVFNHLGLRLSSALDGLGVAYMPEDQVLPYVAEGRLIRVLEDWCPYFLGYHLYYPSRRHSSPALALLVDILRYRGN
jgi:DNA-binding transcriptional LysR family regulator